jgi:hypothetical protein
LFDSAQREGLADVLIFYDCQPGAEADQIPKHENSKNDD